MTVSVSVVEASRGPEVGKKAVSDRGETLVRGTDSRVEAVSRHEAGVEWATPMAITDDRRGAKASGEWRELYGSGSERNALFTTISGLENP